MFTVVVAIDLLGTGEPGVATLTAAVGAGAVVGSLVVSLLVGSRRLAGWFRVGIALWAARRAHRRFPAEAAALGLLACVGVGNALVDLGGFTLMARLAPDDVLAVFFGLLESLVALAVGLGAIVGSLFVELVGVRLALVVVGLLCPILVAASLYRLRRLDRFIGVRDSEIRLLQTVPMLSPLPLPRHRESGAWPAAGLGPRWSTRGVFGQGHRDPASTWSVRDRRGHRGRTPGRNPRRRDGFGEIALLRRVPRTATVLAVSEHRRQALRGDRFLPVVLGYTPAREQGDGPRDARPLHARVPSNHPDSEIRLIPAYRSEDRDESVDRIRVISWSRFDYQNIGAGEGVEPLRPLGHGDLSPARLPVTPLPPASTWYGRSDGEFATQLRHVARGAHPYIALSIRPPSSTTKVERMTPTTGLPYIIFSPYAP